MGGNDPAIVLPDVDVKAAAEKIYGGAFLNAGQVCLAVKRAYVHSDIYDEFCAELAALAEQAVVDDGMKQGTTIGPIQNKRSSRRSRAFWRTPAPAARSLRAGRPTMAPGYFVPPTIVRDVTDGQKIVDEEQFGPVLPVIRFDDIDDVIARANASDYGLGGSVHSSDTAKATEIAGRIESGTIWVNQQLNIGPHIPMAGFKGSGLGVEQSVEGLAEYTQMQVINVARG